MSVVDGFISERQAIFFRWSQIVVMFRGKIA